MYRLSETAGPAADLALPAPTAFPPADPAPLDTPTRGWLHWLGLAIPITVLVAVVLQIRTLNLGEVEALLPVSAAFWLTFALYYAAPIVSEWAIFRRLWRIPPSGLVALTRKHIGNEVLLGYGGDVYFYIWARRRSQMVGAPFGAIKDVAILSAVVGNAATLAMMALAYPFLGELQWGLDGTAFYLSTFMLVATSLAALLFRRRLFSLPAGELRFVVGVHTLRILVTTALTGLMWHLVLPEVQLGWWVLLAALRLLLSRLPFLPDKDLAFAGLAVMAIGHDSEIAAVLTIVGTLVMATHVLLGLLLMGGELAGPKGRT